MEPELLIEIAPNPDSGKWPVLIGGGDPTWNRELFHAIRALRDGRDAEVRAHELPGFGARDGLKISLHRANSYMGLKACDTTSRRFEWHRTPEGWREVENMLAPFCTRGLPIPATADLETVGDGRVIFVQERFGIGPLGRKTTQDPIAGISIGGLAHRRCVRHPLQNATSLCHHCTTALCKDCAACDQGHAICVGGCSPQGELRFCPDADRDYGSLLLIDSEVAATRELFHAIRSLRHGGVHVMVHQLRGFSPRSPVQLILLCSSSGQGVRKEPGTDTFRWTLPPTGWEAVEDALAAACDRYWDNSGSLHLEKDGDAHIVLGGDW